MRKFSVAEQQFIGEMKASQEYGWPYGVTPEQLNRMVDILYSNTNNEHTAQYVSKQAMALAKSRMENERLRDENITLKQQLADAIVQRDAIEQEPRDCPVSVAEGGKGV